MDRDLNIWVHNNPHGDKKEAKPHSDAILQQLIQNTLNTSNHVAVLKTQHGKPYTHEPILFSHSNSRNLYAYVISTTEEVAIDIEKIDESRDVLKLAMRYFHQAEYQHLLGLDKSKQVLGFYQLWTQKEAWCKLDGGQMWSYLGRSVLPPTTIKTTDGSPVFMYDNNQLKGFACTVAATAPYQRIRINNLA